MLKIYFEERFKDKTSAQLEHIKQMLMAVNVHIASSSLTNAGFALAAASTVAVGMNSAHWLAVGHWEESRQRVYMALFRMQQIVHIVFKLFTLNTTQRYIRKSWKWCTSWSNHCLSEPMRLNHSGYRIVVLPILLLKWFDNLWWILLGVFFKRLFKSLFSMYGPFLLTILFAVIFARFFQMLLFG